jgi:hypothetical protein
MSSSAKRGRKSGAAHKAGAGGSGSTQSSAASAAPETLENSPPASIETASPPAGAETGPSNREAAAGAGSTEVVPTADSARVCTQPGRSRWLLLVAHQTLSQKAVRLLALQSLLHVLC